MSATEHTTSLLPPTGRTATKSHRSGPAASHRSGPAATLTSEVDCVSALLGDVGIPTWDPGPRGHLVVLAPHPDDETLGAGGIIHDLAADGWAVTIVAITDGEAAYGSSDAAVAEQLARTRRLEQSRALAQLGRVSVVRLGLADGHVASGADRLADALQSTAAGASQILSTWRRDGHPDNEAAGEAAERVARELGVGFAEFPVCAWQWAEPESLPQSRLRVWPLSPRARVAKREALRAYRSQMQPPGRAPILPAHVVARLLRPVEIVLV